MHTTKLNVVGKGLIHTPDDDQAHLRGEAFSGVEGVAVWMLIPYLIPISPSTHPSMRRRTHRLAV